MTDLRLYDDEILQHGTFRALLKALSRPGTVQPLPERAQQDPLPALLAALLDPEIGFHLAGEDPALSESIVRGTGSRRVPPERAAFLIAPRGESAGCLARLPRGVPEYPDRGATAVYRVESLCAEGGSEPWTGPGIKERAWPLLCGLGDRELATLQEINCDFPLGVDALFVDRTGQVMGLPRSTRIGG